MRKLASISRERKYECRYDSVLPVAYFIYPFFSMLSEKKTKLDMATESTLFQHRHVVSSFTLARFAIAIVDKEEEREAFEVLLYA